jgi:hypothetical protein
LQITKEEHFVKTVSVNENKKWSGDKHEEGNETSL